MEPDGFKIKSVSDMINSPQYGDARTSSGFAALEKITLQPGESISIASFYGKADHIEDVPAIAKHITKAGYVGEKYRLARSMIDDLNFRDVAQNRRDDVTFTPRIGSFDVQMFLSFIQADAYKPLTVEAVVYSIKDKNVAAQIAAESISDAKSAETLTDVLNGGSCISAPFRQILLDAEGKVGPRDSCVVLLRQQRTDNRLFWVLIERVSYFGVQCCQQGIPAYALYRFSYLFEGNS